jgi:hypothetical protein
MEELVWEDRSIAELGAQLSVWPLWLAHDATQAPLRWLAVARLIATRGVSGDIEQVAISESPSGGRAASPFPRASRS